MFQVGNLMSAPRVGNSTTSPLGRERIWPERARSMRTTSAVSVSGGRPACSLPKGTMAMGRAEAVPSLITMVGTSEERPPWAAAMPAPTLSRSAATHRAKSLARMGFCPSSFVLEFEIEFTPEHRLESFVRQRRCAQHCLLDGIACDRICSAWTGDVDRDYLAAGNLDDVDHAAQARRRVVRTHPRVGDGVLDGRVVLRLQRIVIAFRTG